jgi:hypothetical protein
MATSLEEISKFVEQKTTEQEKMFFIDAEVHSKIQQARQLIRDFSIPEKKTFTFTAGELNAYMG